MSSASFASTVDLALQPSYRGLRVLFLLHVVALALLPLALSGWPLALLAAAFAGSWLWLRRHPALGFGRRPITRAVWLAEGPWTLYRPGAAPASAELLGSSYVHPRLLVLNFRLQDGAHQSRVLLGDEAPADLLQRLRARLNATG